MPSYRYIISSQVYNNIDNFYANVATKYSNTYSLDLLLQNTTDAYDSIYKIENGLLRRNPTISRWQGYYMANTKKWYFAYRIDDNTIYVEDACHAQNMHESIKSKWLNNAISLLERICRIK